MYIYASSFHLTSHNTSYSSIIMMYVYMNNIYIYIIIYIYIYILACFCIYIYIHCIYICDVYIYIYIFIVYIYICDVYVYIYIHGLWLFLFNCMSFVWKKHSPTTDRRANMLRSSSTTEATGTKLNSFTGSRLLCRTPSSNQFSRELVLVRKCTTMMQVVS